MPPAGAGTFCRSICGKPYPASREPTPRATAVSRAPGTTSQRGRASAGASAQSSGAARHSPSVPDVPPAARQVRLTWGWGEVLGWLVLLLSFGDHGRGGALGGALGPEEGDPGPERHRPLSALAESAVRAATEVRMSRPLMTAPANDRLAGVAHTSCVSFPDAAKPGCDAFARSRVKTGWCRLASRPAPSLKLGYLERTRTPIVGLWDCAPV
jgi:hypothetical protein